MSTFPFREIVRILFRFDPHARLNLFDAFPIIKHFFLHRSNLLIVRSIGDIFFVLVILSGLFGPQDPTRNIALFAAWGLWWTSLVISWFFVGKLWCGLCPFPGIGRLIQSSGLALKRPMPGWMRKHGANISLSLFALIIWTETATDMHVRPALTSILLLSIVGGATFFGALYEGQSWCRYLCPLGKIIGSAATISMVEFRPDPTRCRKCGIFACVKGKGGTLGCPIHLGAFTVRDSMDCLMCGHCVVTCDHDSPHLNLRNSFAELVLNRGRYLAYAYIIPFLMGSQLARLIHDKPWYQDSIAYFGNSKALQNSIIIAVGYAFIWMLLQMGSHLLRPNSHLNRMSPMVSIFIPFAFNGELVCRLEYFLTQAGQAIPTFGRQFGIPLDAFGFVVSAQLIHITGLVLLLFGGASSIKVLALISSADKQQSIPFYNRMLLSLLICIVLAAYLLVYWY